MARPFRLCLALGPFLLASCDEAAVCPAASFAGVHVHALSAADATPILGALGEVRDGSYADSLVELGEGGYEAAYDRPGTYAVHLEHAGYEGWDTSGVVVHDSGGDCPLITTVQVGARLAPVD
jgi:hypothetical protein